MKTQNKFLLILTLGSITAFAGPVTTVAWNGHTGAASFTYDDARDGQIPNLLPQLDTMGIKATFEIAAANVGTFLTRKTDWLREARSYGHELANHTYNHQNMPTGTTQATDTVHFMAAYLRGLDTSIQAVTFAYPNCSIGGEPGVSTENFIGRGCGGTTYAWGTQPSDWMNVQGLIVTNNVTTSATTELTSAKTGNTWATIIIHDVVSPTPDIYSVTPANSQVILNSAVSNNLWIDTYMRVGSYYRAHFTMDTAKAVAITGGWTLAWVSPHPKMPKSVPLRVKLAAATFGNSITVMQGSTVIAPQLDSSYIIDFMKLSMTVLQGTSSIKARRFIPSNLQAEVTPTGIRLGGVVGALDVTVSDVQGHAVFHGRVTDRIVPLRQDQMRGILFVTVTNHVKGVSVRTMLNAVR